MDRDSPPPTKPENRRPWQVVPGIPRERVSTEVQRKHPSAERTSPPPPPPRSISPFPERQVPPIIVEQAPPPRRSFWPRELPSWVGKAAAALFAAVVLPNVPAITRRIDAGTAVVVAEAEYKRELAKTEQAKQGAEQARQRAEEAKVATATELIRRQNEQETKLENCESLEERVARLEGDNALGIFASSKKRKPRP